MDRKHLIHTKPQSETTPKYMRSKWFKTMKEAEQYQNRLYNLYNIVRLIIAPTFGEEGIYTWKVADPI